MSGARGRGSGGGGGHVNQLEVPWEEEGGVVEVVGEEKTNIDLCFSSHHL